MSKIIIHLAITVILVIASMTTLLSQIEYKSGYYINNNNQKVQCLIKDMGWKTNPESISIKQSHDAKGIKLGMKDVKEFSINKQSYKKYIVDIDRTNSQPNSLNKSVEPLYIRDTVFLKLIAEGTSSLYEYRYGNYSIFYFQKDDQKIEHLVFKKYKDASGKIKSNNRFKAQLWNAMPCEAITSTELADLEYTKKSLTNFFRTYYNCKGDSFNISELKEKKSIINLTIGAGLKRYNIQASNSVFSRKLPEYPTGLGYIVQLEEEFVPPFNHGKWTFLLGQTYQSLTVDNVDNSATLQYNSIQFSAGTRYNFFIKKSRLYLNISYIVDVPINSKITLESTAPDYIISGGQTWTIGGGYGINRFSLEYAMYGGRNITRSYDFLNHTIKDFAIIFKYRLFTSK